MTETTQSARHRQRWNDLAKNFGASVSARLIAALGGLAQVPFALHHLGSEAFGFWMLLTGTLTLLNLADLGLGLGLQNRMATHYAKDEPAAVAGLLRYGLAQLTVTAAILAPVLGLAVFLVDWPRLLNLTDPGLISLTRPCLLLLVAGFCVNLPLTLGPRLAAAAQRSWLVPWWACVGTLAQLLAVVAVTWAEASVVAYVAIFLGVQILQNIAVGAQLRLALPALTGKSTPPDAPARRELRATGDRFFVQQACATFSTAFLPVALAIFGSPAVVTQFNLLQRIFGPLLQVQWMVARPLWPAYTEALARGDGRWIRHSFRASLGFVALLGAGLLICAVGMRPILELWLGEQVPVIETGLLVASALWFGGLLVSHPFATLLGGLGHATGSAVYWAFTTAVFLAGTFVFGPTHGAAAVAYSAAGAITVLLVPAMVTEATLRYRQALARLK